MRKAVVLSLVLSAGLVMGSVPSFASSCHGDGKDAASCQPDGKKAASCDTHKSHGGKTTKAKKAASKKVPAYSCPMHPEVTSKKAGKCPECGMFLEKKAAAPKEKAQAETGTETKTVPAPAAYSCPMHPEVTSDEPGKCPECGMFLEQAGAVKPANAGNHQGHQH